MKITNLSTLRQISLSSLSALGFALSSCDSEEASTDSESEPKPAEPAPAKKEAAQGDLTSVKGILVTEGEFVWALNQLILDSKTAEDAKAAVPKIEEMKSQAQEIAEARRKFPTLENEKALMSEYFQPVQRLMIGRQSLGFTIRTKRNHVKEVHAVLQPTLDELFGILPAPHQLRDGSE